MDTTQEILKTVISMSPGHRGEEKSFILTYQTYEDLRFLTLINRGSK
jgi:hypothetical protein